MPLPDDLPDDLVVENLSDTDNVNTTIRRAMSASEETERYVKLGELFLKEGVKCAEIAERLARTAFYIAAAERPTKIDDSGQSDDLDGPDDPDDPSPDPYDPVIKPNGKAVDGTYSEP